MKTVHIIHAAVQSQYRRTAVYCRVSTERDDQLNSLDNQIRHFSALLDQNPDWKFAGFYCDSGISGTSAAKRPGLQNLLAACRNQEIDLILTKSISRFARNTLDCLNLIKELRALQVQVYFEKENLYTGSYEGDLMLTVLASLAEDESRSISENCRWTIQNHFKDGTFTLSRPPFGYLLKNGTLQIETTEVEVVKEIFQDAISGIGSPTIAKKLNTAQIPTKRGGNWHSGTILHMISNELYVGDLRLQKTWRDDRYRVHINHGEQPQYYIRDHHAPIVTRQIFQEANEAIHRRDTFCHMENDQIPADNVPVLHPDPRQNRYCFTGRLKCSICGDNLVRKYRRRCGKNIPGWVCRRHIKSIDECRGVWILEEELWKSLLSFFASAGMEKLPHTLKAFIKPLSMLSDTEKREYIKDAFPRYVQYLELDDRFMRCVFQCAFELTYDTIAGGLYGN